jgi:outer membrane protein TolC
VELKKSMQTLHGLVAAGVGTAVILSGMGFATARTGHSLLPAPKPSPTASEPALTQSASEQQGSPPTAASDLTPSAESVPDSAQPAAATLETSSAEKLPQQKLPPEALSPEKLSVTSQKADTPPPLHPKPDQLVQDTSTPEAKPADLNPADLNKLQRLNPSADALKILSQPDQVKIGVEQPLTLAATLQLARRNNLSLQIAELQLQRNRAILRRTLASLFPTLSLLSVVSRQVNASGEVLNSPIQPDQQQELQQEQQSQLEQALQEQTQESAQQLQQQISRLQQRFQRGQLSDPGQDEQNLEFDLQLDQLETNADTAVQGSSLSPISLSPLISDLSTSSADTPTPNGFSTALGINYNLFTSGQRDANIRAAREQVRLAELEVQRQDEQLRLDVANDYYNAQQADVQVQIAQAAVANAESSLRDAEARERAGLGTRFDVLQVQVTRANAIQNLNQAVSLQRITRRQIVQRLNLADTVTISIADPVVVAGLWKLSQEETIVLALRNRVELAQRILQRNIAVQNRRAALASLGPRVTVSAELNTGDNITDDFLLQHGYSVSMQVSLALFDGGEARASAARQEANIEIAQTQYAELKTQIRLQVERAFASLQSNLENLQTARLSVEQATEGLRLARLRFQAGVGTQANVTSAQADLTQAQGNLLSAILDYNRALVSLQRSVSYAVTPAPFPADTTTPAPAPPAP